MLGGSEYLSQQNLAELLHQLLTPYLLSDPTLSPQGSFQNNSSAPALHHHRHPLLLGSGPTSSLCEQSPAWPGPTHLLLLFTLSAPSTLAFVQSLLLPSVNSPVVNIYIFAVRGPPSGPLHMLLFLPGILFLWKKENKTI